jgi:hypothetical protein
VTHKEMAAELRAAGWLVIPPLPDDVAEPYDPSVCMDAREVNALAMDSINPPANVKRWTREIEGEWFLYERDYDLPGGRTGASVRRVVLT